MSDYNILVGSDVDVFEVFLKMQISSNIVMSMLAQFYEFSGTQVMCSKDARLVAVCLNTQCAMPQL